VRLGHRRPRCLGDRGVEFGLVFRDFFSQRMSRPPRSLRRLARLIEFAGRRTRGDGSIILRRIRARGNGVRLQFGIADAIRGFASSLGLRDAPDCRLNGVFRG
jgi:hypothetical protein